MQTVEKGMWSAVVPNPSDSTLFLAAECALKHPKSRMNVNRPDQRLTLALKAGRAGTFEWDIKGNKAVWSDELLALYGMAREEFGGTYEEWLATVVPEDRDVAGQAIQQSFDTGTLEADLRIRRRDTGEIRWMNCRGILSRDESGKVSAMTGINVDVTELKRAQERSEASEKRFQTVLETEAVGVLFLDRSGRVTGANKPFLRMTGYNEDEVQSGNLTWRNLTPEDWTTATEEQMKKLASTGSIGPYEKEIFLKNGQRRWMRFTGREIADGTIAEYCFDIHDEKEAEAELRKSEERFRFISDGAQIGYWDWDLPTDTLEFSPRCKRMFGLPEGEAVTYETFRSALHPEDRERTDQIVRACLDGTSPPEYDNEYRAVWPDGTVHWLRAKGAATFQHGRALRMAGIVIDISEAKRVEKALEESMERIRHTESQFQMLAESVPQLVWSCNPAGECDYLSSQWIAYTGIPSSEQLGYRWLERLHPEDRSGTMAHWNHAVQSGEIFDVEYRILSRHGRYRWFKTRAMPHRNERGEIIKWFGTSTDIEDQKRVEAELRQANADLQQFAYSASHDLKQPLRNIVIYGQLLVRNASQQLDAETLKLLDVVIKNGQRMSQLLSDLLEYSSATRGEGEEPVSIVNPRTALENVISSLQSSIAENGAVITHDSLPSVRMNEVHLQQLFQNLISNGIKYRKETEPPRLQISAEPAGYFWKFSIADNGIGIDPQHHAQVFGLFKRLHGKDAKYEGTGLGLAICQKIVERYGGRIWFESEVNKGTAFYFTLPRPE